jgi:hypothetical protein
MHIAGFTLFLAASLSRYAVAEGVLILDGFHFKGGDGARAGVADCASFRLRRPGGRQHTLPCRPPMLSARPTGSACSHQARRAAKAEAAQRLLADDSTGIDRTPHELAEGVGRRRIIGALAWLSWIVSRTVEAGFADEHDRIDRRFQRRRHLLLLW